ncbi:MAG: transposase [Spirosomataceae bacterium]
MKIRWRIGIIKVARCGGQFRYSDKCIQAALALKAVFRLAFRQTQGLIQSVLATMKLNLQVPSYTQLCRRQAK